VPGSRACPRFRVGRTQVASQQGSAAGRPGRILGDVACRKRVASHFSKPGARGAVNMVSHIDHIEFVVTQTEAEALLAEKPACVAESVGRVLV
jgi:hypothetical protein